MVTECSVTLAPFAQVLEYTPQAAKDLHLFLHHRLGCDQHP